MNKILAALALCTPLSATDLDQVELFTEMMFYGSDWDRVDAQDETLKKYHLGRRDAYQSVLIYIWSLEDQDE